MEEESDFEIHGGQIIHQLKLVSVLEFVSGLGFDDYTAIHEHVDTVKSDLRPLEKHFDREFTLHLESASAERDFQAAHVYPFAKAKAQLIVSFEKTSNDLARKRLFEEAHARGALAPLGTIRVHPGNPCPLAEVSGTMALRLEACHCSRPAR